MDNQSFPPPMQPPKPAPKQLGYQDLRLIRYFLFAAAILCPLSFFFGILFSIASVVFSSIALAKVVKLANKSEGAVQTAAKRTLIIVLLCFSLCVVIMIMNIISLIILFPIILEAVKTGDFSALGLSEEALKTLQPNEGSKTWG